MLVLQLPPILRVRVSVEDSEPEIWRLLEVDATLTLAEVHEALQIAMGWEQSHLHAFEHPDSRRWLDQGSLDEGLDGADERTVTLGEVLTEDSGPLAYEYDFGDSWHHRIELVEVITGDPEVPRARLLRGERRAPLEDSGGIHGYTELLGSLADPSAEDHEEMAGWVAGTSGPWAEPFDPEALEIGRVNRALTRRFDPSGDDAQWGASLARMVPRMYPGAQVAFGSYLDAAQLDRPVLFDAELAARSVLPFTWLLERVGPAGLALTAAGRLPPAVVREAAAAFGWDETWVGKANREDHLPPAADLREFATRSGLVRKQKGRLLITAAARAYGGDPLALLRRLASRWLGLKRFGAAKDASVLFAAELAVGGHPDRREVADRIAYGLSALGWVAGDRWTPVSGESVRYLLGEDWSLLVLLGLADDSFFGRPALSPTAARDFARAALQTG